MYKNNDKQPSHALGALLIIHLYFAGAAIISQADPGGSTPRNYGGVTYESTHTVGPSMQIDVCTPDTGLPAIIAGGNRITGPSLRRRPVTVGGWRVRHGAELRNSGRAEHTAHAGTAGPLSSQSSGNILLIYWKTFTLLKYLHCSRAKVFQDAAVIVR
ncbi:hypothetical protein ACJJTC_006470 [Scirpophaga incertulas]